MVYVADQDRAGTFELFSVPVGGGLVTRLNQPMIGGGDVVDFRISPASSHVLFRADAETDEPTTVDAVKTDPAAADPFDNDEDTGVYA